MVKIVAYYLLLVALVDSPFRLRSFLFWLIGLTLLLSGLAILHYQGVIQIESLNAVGQSDIDAESGLVQVIPRLQSTGVFNDPNDLSMILVLGIIGCIYFIETSSGIGRFLFLAPLGVFLYGLRLTYSRGGLLSLGSGLFVLFGRVKFGWKKAICARRWWQQMRIVLFGGRMTSVNLGDRNDTSQHRIQLWSQGLDLFRESPLFGVGMNEYAERAGLVAHNSFVHTYAELGFFGGTMFAGAFYGAISSAKKVGDDGVMLPDSIVKRLQP